MPEHIRVEPERETSVNPYSLLEAVNSSSDTAHTAWLIFLGIMTYFMIAVAGVTHKDLLLETPVELPILQVRIQMAQFFQFAPVVLVLFHLGVVCQLVLLARKTMEFDHALRFLETSDRRTHPLRLELNSFFFVQAIAGPHRSIVMSAFLHAMSWLTLVVLPVVLLLYIQIVFLPYHDAVITWTQRVALLVDIGMLVLIGVFLTRAEPSFFQAFWRTTVAHPFSVFMTSVLFGIVGLVSLFLATIPGERLDVMAREAVGALERQAEARESRLQRVAALPFLAFRADGSLFGIFRRHLEVTDADLVVDKEVTAGEPSLNLRGRDLRFARLDRSDLHQVDLTGANLDGASLVGADLRGAWLHCADLNQLLLAENRAAARCTSAQGADLARASLGEAHMAGIDLRGAKLEEARGEAAELAYALLAGANLSGAQLDKADLTGGVQGQGANFLLASLRGADATGAQLHGADLSSAALQGTMLAHAQLQGAALRDADLEGASLAQANLRGADMTGASATAADARGAAIWMTQPPQADATGLADFGELVLRPPDDGDVDALTRVLERIDGAGVREEVRDALAPLMAVAEARRWAGSVGQLRWQGYALASPHGAADAYRSRLTEHLTRTMCKPRLASGGFATGIARRAQASGFRGDAAVVYERLRADDCPASRTVSARVMREFSTAVDLARAN
jgi:uncharacterized protein YjbI with pentapeptide repeats